MSEDVSSAMLIQGVSPYCLVRTPCPSASHAQRRRRVKKVAQLVRAGNNSQKDDERRRCDRGPCVRREVVPPSGALLSPKPTQGLPNPTRGRAGLAALGYPRDAPSGADRRSCRRLGAPQLMSSLLDKPQPQIKPDERRWKNQTLSTFNSAPEIFTGVRIRLSAPSHRQPSQITAPGGTALRKARA
jgi:hypothetical protein